MIPLVVSLQLFRGDTIISDAPPPNALKLLEDLQTHGVMRKRLSQMRSRKEKRESEADPFRKTLLEKIRERAGRSISISREDWIRCRLRWFADNDWRRAELEKLLDLQLTERERLQKINPIRHAVDYGVDFTELRNRTVEIPRPNYDDYMLDEPVRDWQNAFEAPEHQPIILPEGQSFDPGIEGFGFGNGECDMIGGAAKADKLITANVEETATEICSTTDDTTEFSCTPKREVRLLPICVKVEQSYSHQTPSSV